jgi:4-carboxymuconolactone decarboxylase
MTRLRYIDPKAMTAEQQALYDSIANGPRAKKRKSLVDEQGRLTGPFNAFLHHPKLGAHWSAIGETLRFHTAIDRRLFELAALVVAAYWRSGHEWAAHSVFARELGIAEEAIEAIRDGKEPVLEKPDEAIIYRFARAMTGERRVDAKTYGETAALLGEAQLVELVNMLGYYIGLAVMLNAFDVHPPKGLDDPWL